MSQPVFAFLHLNLDFFFKSVHRNIFIDVKICKFMHIYKIYIYMYIYIYLHIHICIFVHVLPVAVYICEDMFFISPLCNASKYICIYIFTYTYMYICVHKYLCQYVICKHDLLHYMYTPVFTRIHVHICTHVSTCTYAYIHVNDSCM